MEAFKRTMSGDLADVFNNLSDDELCAEFRKCCGSQWWCERMLAERPFASVEALRDAADRTFAGMPRDAWLEAFASHPQIGDLESLKMKFAGNREWSAGEQSGVLETNEETLIRLRDGNALYLERFGYIFIVCATGKAAEEMLEILERRLANDAETELREAAAQQQRITLLRLEKLLASVP